MGCGRSNPHIDIWGMVNDAVEGLIGAAESAVSVQVNGQSVVSAAAQVADRHISGARLLFEIGMPFQSSQYIDA